MAVELVWGPPVGSLSYSASDVYVPRVRVRTLWRIGHGVAG